MDPDVESVTVRQAYVAMFFFLKRYNDRGPTDELEILLGAMDFANDRLPRDQGLWDDWVEVVASARAESKPRNEP